MSGIGPIDIQDWDYVHVEATHENEDGSMDCQIKMGPLATKFLLNFAFVNALKTAMAEGKLYTPTEDKPE
jgi:hypothetical protein